MQHAFRVGDIHQVEPSLNSVIGPAGTIRLEPKVMQVLVLLAAHAGQVVAKERLIQTVWPDAFVTDDVLTRAISELRRVFGDDARESRFIQTIPKSGYRLIARVSNGAGRERVCARTRRLRIGTIPPGDDRVIAPLTELGRASGGDGTLLRSRKGAVWVIGFTLVMLAGVLVWRWQGTSMQCRPCDRHLTLRASRG